MNTKPQQKKPIENPQEVGWLEKRWRMVKGAASGVLDYLTKPKTYLFAAGAVGVTMLLGMGPPATAIGVGMYAAKMVVAGTAMHMVTDMLKAGKEADDETKQAHQCNGKAHCQEQDVPQKQQNRSPHDVSFDDVRRQDNLPSPTEAGIEVAEQITGP